jgi:hypothetical protein
LQILKESVVKRFAEGNTELLRTVITLPHPVPDEGSAEETETFYRDIGSHSLRFSEEQLLPILRKRYAALSPHDRKFHVPKYVYSVDAEPYDLSPVCFSIRLTATLSRRGAVLFQSEETHTWGLREGRFLLIPKEKKK